MPRKNKTSKSSNIVSAIDPVVTNGENRSWQPEMDLTNIYCKHIDIYTHLDNLIWTSFAGIFTIIFGSLTLVFNLTKTTETLIIVLAFVLLFLSLILLWYKDTLKKFHEGRSFVTALLCSIEQKSDLFSDEIATKKGNHKSFFIRRVTMSKNNKGLLPRIVSMEKIIAFLWILFLVVSLLLFLLILLGLFNGFFIDPNLKI